MLWALAAVVAFDVTVARGNWVWEWFPGSGGGMFQVLERRVIASAERPAVVVFGSSRARDAVPPRELEAALELPPGSVLNLSLDGGTPSDALALYRRNRDTLRKAAVLVVGVEDWYLNAAMPPNPRDRRFADLSQRMEMFRGWDRAELVAGRLWRTLDVRAALRNRLARAGRGRGLAPLAPDGRVQWRTTESIDDEGPPETDLTGWVDRFYGDSPAGLGRYPHIRELVALATQDDVRVAIIRFPRRAAYIDLVRQRYPISAKRATEAFEALHGPAKGVVTSLLDRADDLGLGPTDFYDYGHVTPRGAKKVARAVASILADAWPVEISARTR